MRNRVVVGMAVWLVGVTSVAGLAWVAIDSAGKSVTALPIAPSGVSQPLDPSATRTPTTAPTSTPPVAPSSTGQPTGILTGALSVSIEPTASETDPTATRTGRPSQSSTRPTPKPPRLIQETRSGYWGSVTVGCQAWRVSLRSASPADTWSMDVRSSRPPQVVVVFSRKGDQVRVEGACAGGRPAITLSFSD